MSWGNPFQEAIGIWRMDLRETSQSRGRPFQVTPSITAWQSEEGFAVNFKSWFIWCLKKKKASYQEVIVGQSGGGPGGEYRPSTDNADCQTDSSFRPPSKTHSSCRLFETTSSSSLVFDLRQTSSFNSHGRKSFVLKDPRTTKANLDINDINPVQLDSKYLCNYA